MHIAPQLIVLFFILLASMASATTYFVRPQGNDQAVGTSAAVAFRTITRAAAAFQAGDRLVIAPGTYKETVPFMECIPATDTPMAIIGDEDGKLTGAVPGEVVIVCASASDPGIGIHRFKNLTISGLTFRGPGQGIAVSQSQHITIERCTFDGLARGLAIMSTRDARVESSVFLRCATGISCSQAVRTRVAQVTIAGSNSVGLLALMCGNGEIRNVLFTDNNTNLVGDTLTAAAWTSDYNVLSGVTGPWGDVPTRTCPYEWFAKTGQERHSEYVSPVFVAPEAGNLRVSPVVQWGGGLPGQRAGVVLTPKVVRDRDGKPFRERNGRICAGAYDYPDSQAGKGWQKLAVKPVSTGVRQSAGIYAEDGSLIRLLFSDAAGVTDVWWDGLTDTGSTAAVGKYVLKSIAHDVRALDDGSLGDNGSPKGMFNPDSPARILPLADGGFLVGCYADEAGYAIRRYNATGFSVHAANHLEKGFQAMAANGNDIYELVARSNWQAGTITWLAITCLSEDGEQIPLPNGADFYVIEEKEFTAPRAGGLAVVGQTAYVGIRGLDVVRVINLTNGQKIADYPLPALTDIAADADGTVWALSGTDLVALDATGGVAQRIATGLAHPTFLAAGADRFAIADSEAMKIALLERDDKTIKFLGQPRGAKAWAPVAGDVFRTLSGCALLSDGKLAVAMANRVRLMWPDTGVIFKDIVSDFVDSGVAHPTRPEYVYTGLGVFRVDPTTGAWLWVAEAPLEWEVQGKNGKTARMSFGIPAGAVVLDGKPFIVYNPQHDPMVYDTASAYFFDVSDPLQPKFSQEVTKVPPWGWWANFAFARNGDLYQSEGTTRHRLRRYLGLNPAGQPQYEPFEMGMVIGMENDPIAERGMEHKQGPALDDATGDIFQLAVTRYNNKMIAGWGANTTGIGKYRKDGAPLWFVPSSGSTYVAMDAINDGKSTWVMGCKAFGGQVDVFTTDGLRLATSDWGWPNNYNSGFVDIRYGIRAYRDPSGVVKALIEDDGLGKVSRIRLEGMNSVTTGTAALEWKKAAAARGDIPDPQYLSTAPIRGMQTIPYVVELPVDGDWSAWEKAGVVPQMLVLPIPTFARAMPEEALQQMREGTALGAFAHDSKNLYVYYIVANASPELAPTNVMMYAYDSLEFWAEEEQFGLGLLRENKPGFYKYRFHSVDGKAYAPGRDMPRELVWATALDDVGAHPLGRLLAANTGVSFAGKKGYAVMVKIPFEEIKLTGGVGGRNGNVVQNMTGQPGEILRLGVNVSGILSAGREQDFKMGWPCGLLFADPSTMAPFVLGGPVK